MPAGPARRIVLPCGTKKSRRDGSTMAEGRTIGIQSMINRLAGAAALLAVVGSFAAQPALAGDAANGRVLAERWCSGCHLIGGPGPGSDVAPPFTGDRSRSGQEPRPYPGLVGDAPYGHAEHAVEPPRYRRSGQLYRIPGTLEEIPASRNFNFGNRPCPDNNHYMHSVMALFIHPLVTAYRCSIAH